MYNLYSQYGIIYINFNEEYEDIQDKLSIYDEVKIFKLPEKKRIGICFGKKSQLRGFLRKSFKISCIDRIRIKLFLWEKEIFEERKQFYPVFNDPLSNHICEEDILEVKGVFGVLNEYVDTPKINLPEVKEDVILEPEAEVSEKTHDKTLFSTQLANYYWYKFKNEIEMNSKAFPMLMTLTQGKHLVPIDRRVNEETSSEPLLVLDPTVMNKKFQFEDYPTLELQYGSFFETKMHLGLLIELNESNNPSPMLQEVRKLLTAVNDQAKSYSCETQQEFFTVGYIEKLVILNYSQEVQHSKDLIWRLEKDILRRLFDIVNRNTKIKSIGLTNLTKGIKNCNDFLIIFIPIKLIY